MERLSLYLFLILLSTLSEVKCQTGESEMGQKVTKILDEMTKGYDKRVRPNYGGLPVTVGVTMYVLSISSISPANMDFTMDFYFRQTWADPRLKFTAPGISTVSVGSDMIRSLWVPDTFFVNEKRSYFHTATANNEYLRIDQQGNVLRSFRLTITASCPMDLQFFPMDRQLCVLEMESFGYTMSDIRYDWAQGANSVGIASDVSLPEFKVTGFRQQKHEISLSTGNYSRLSCEIQFVRSMGYYLTSVYIPAAICVILSWVAFWIRRDATTARTTIGITTIIMIYVLFMKINDSVPKISYVKAIDLYLVTCFFSVFASLLESAAVGYVKNHFRVKADDAKSEPNGGEFLGSENPLPETPNENQPEKKPNRIAHVGRKVMDKMLNLPPAYIDMTSRVLFPLCFTVFNVIYWVFYMRVTNIVENDLIILD